ncbi:hypothetical protein BDV26DRAFT_302788 [Aspergillus bertholletiae]|uniref:F-box domain-containing protein n=1 Tax=Aspergillus bertholletiae TaxID=1226010 RepID=A0A5N7AR89_9EURO|nr:hypothetical protein BDV26DRAFT_302788 [Aspergillus bertholletiae]
MEKRSPFEHLPVELLDIITREVIEDSSIKSLSCVSGILRLVCYPYLFHTLKIRFSLDGLTRLKQISASKVAHYVNVINYEASELIDPLIRSPIYFRRHIYTPEEYIRDENELCWSNRGNTITYDSIYSYFRLLSKEQQEILNKDRDIMSLQSCLPQFTRLTCFQVSFVDGVERPFQWFAGRVLVDWKSSFPDHFENVIRAICAAKQAGIHIRTFQVSSFYSRLPLVGSELTSLAATALSEVEELRLTDSPGLLDFLSIVALPSLQRLELEDCWLWLPELEEFLLAHTSTLQVLHLENAWLPSEITYDWGITWGLGTTKTIINGISKIKIGRALQELTINRKGRNEFEYKRIFKNSACHQ